MKSPKSYSDYFPAMLSGIIEGGIISLAVFCFFEGKEYAPDYAILYTSLIALLIAILFALGAWFTQKEELKNNGTNNKLLKIYHALEIDETLKQAMVADALREEKEWQQLTATEPTFGEELSPTAYSISIFSGFILGATLIIINFILIPFSNFYAIIVPALCFAVFGYIKFSISGKHPLLGVFNILAVGIAAAFCAYYAGILLH